MNHPNARFVIVSTGSISVSECNVRKGRRVQETPGAKCPSPIAGESGRIEVAQLAGGNDRGLGCGVQAGPRDTSWWHRAKWLNRSAMCRLQAGPSAPQTTFEVMLGDLRQWVDLYNTAVVPKQVSLSLPRHVSWNKPVLMLYLLKLFVQS